LIRYLAFFFLLPIIGSAAEATFDATTGLVVADVRIDNRVTGRFGIDTGADRLYIDKEFAETNHLDLEGVPAQRQVVGLNGTSGGYFVTVRTIEVGDQRFHNVNATVVDLAQLSGGSDDHPDGLIGFDLLRRMYVTVDYPHQSFDIEINQPRFLSGRKYETVSFRPANHLIMVDVTLSDGRTHPMALDYCASYTIITPKLADQLGVSAEPDQPLFLDMEIDGKIKSSGVYTVIQDLTPLKRSMPRVPIEGILGRSFLAEHKITIDYRTSQIYLHPSGLADKW